MNTYPSMPIKPLCPTDADFTVRYSQKAKRIILRLLPCGTLEVVLPQGTHPEQAQRAIQIKQTWINKVRQRRAHRLQAKQSKSTQLPLVLPLRGGLEVLIVEPANLAIPYDRSVHIQKALTSQPYKVKHTLQVPDTLLEYGTPATKQISEYIREWVRQQARSLFVPLLSLLADQYCFDYNSVRIKFQKTRWGSCSLRRNINLNGQLLFLPDRLSRYVLLHELCHTQQLNHSQAFWQLLLTCEPQAKALHRELHHAASYIPEY